MSSVIHHEDLKNSLKSMTQGASGLSRLLDLSGGGDAESSSPLTMPSLSELTLSSASSLSLQLLQMMFNQLQASTAASALTRQALQFASYTPSCCNSSNSTPTSAASASKATISSQRRLPLAPLLVDPRTWLMSSSALQDKS